MDGQAREVASEDDGHQLRQISSFLRGSGGNGRAVLHSDFLDARLRRPLLDPGPLRDEAPAARRERGYHVDGRVRRLQLRPAPLRRLPGWRSEEHTSELQ